MNQQFVSHFGQALQRNQLQGSEGHNQANHGQPGGQNNSRERDKSAGSRTRLFDYEMSSPKRSSRMMQPNFGMVGGPDREIVTNAAGDWKASMNDDEAAWRRLRSQEQATLPEIKPKSQQKVQGDGSHAQSMYTEETNPAVSSVYLEKNSSSKNISPREPEHLKKPKKSQPASQERLEQQALPPTEETLVHHENFDNFHRFSPGLRTSSANTYQNIRPDMAAGSRQFDHLNVDSNRIQEPEYVAPRRQPELSRSSSLKRRQAEQIAYRLNDKSLSIVELQSKVSKHSVNQVALKRPITRTSSRISRPSVERMQPNNQDKFRSKLDKKHEEILLNGATNAGLRHISFADHAPPAISTIETQSQRSPRREDESQLIDKRALLERERGSRFGERDKRAIHLFENNRSQEILQRCPPVVQPKILVKGPQHLQGQHHLPPNDFDNTLGEQEVAAFPQQSDISQQNQRQSPIGGEVQREESIKAGPNSRSSGQAANSKLRNTSNNRDNAKDFTDKLLSLKNTLTNIRTNMYKRSKSKSSLFSDGSRNITSSQYDQYFQEKEKQSRQVNHLVKEETGCFHQQKPPNRHENDVRFRMYSDELPSNIKPNDLSNSHMNMTGLEENRMFANLNQSKENMATEEHHRFDSFQRSQEFERLPTNPGKSTNNPSFKLDFMKLDRSQMHRQNQTQNERCLSASVSGVSNQITDQQDRHSRSQHYQARCSCCRHQHSRHQQSSNRRKVPSCQEGTQPQSDMEKLDVADTKIQSSQFNLKEVGGGSRHAGDAQSKESHAERPATRAANQGSCGDVRQTTKRSSRNRSEVEAQESHRNANLKSTIKTQRHPLTEQLSAREILMSNGSLDVQKLLTLIVGTQDSRKNITDHEIQQICGDQLNNLKIQELSNASRPLQKSKSQSIRNLHSHQKSVPQPTSRTFNHIYQETNLLRKVLQLLQEKYPPVQKPEVVPHAQRFALYKQKLQKYSSRQSIHNSANMNSIGSVASPVAAASKNRPVSMLPHHIGNPQIQNQAVQHQESYKSLQTRLELMHRHVVEQQELLQMSKQAEMRKDKRNKELKEALEESERSTSQMKEDIGVLLGALKETEEGRERLRNTQLNLLNAEKNCRTCHPWQANGLDIKSPFANDIIKRMSADGQSQGRPVSSAKQFLQHIEQTLQQSTYQTGQQSLKLCDQESVDEFCKRLSKEKRFIAKVQRMVRDQERNFYFSKDSQPNETSLKLQHQAVLPKLSECWKWQKNLVNEFNQLKKVKENFEEIIQNQNQLISQLLEAKHLKGLMDREFNDASMQLKDYPGNSATSQLIDRKMQTQRLSRSQYLLPPKSTTSYSGQADPSSETQKLSSKLSSWRPRDGRDKRKKVKSKAETQVNTHRTNQVSNAASNQLTFTPSGQTSQHRQQHQEAIEEATTFSQRPRKQNLQIRDLQNNNPTYSNLSKIDESTIDRVACGESKEIGTITRNEHPLGPPTLSLCSGDDLVINSNRVSLSNASRLQAGADHQAQQSAVKTFSHFPSRQQELEERPRGPAREISKKKSLRRHSNIDEVEDRRNGMVELDLMASDMAYPLQYPGHHHPQQSLPNFQALASLNSPDTTGLEGSCVVNILTPQIGPNTEPSSQAHCVDPAPTPSNVNTLRRSSQTQPNRMMDGPDLDTMRPHPQLPVTGPILRPNALHGLETGQISSRSTQGLVPPPTVGTPPTEEGRANLYAPQPLPRHKRHKSMGRNVSSFNVAHSGTTGPHLQMSALQVEQLGGEWLASSGCAHHGHTGSMGSHMNGASASRVVYVSNLDVC